jgi:long-chain acyl-CoA synthetase
MEAPLPKEARSLVELFEESARAHASRPVFVVKSGDRWAETSYADFAKLVDQLRGGLAALGVGRGDAVGIIANNRIEWAAVAYATYGLGAALVPMYESQLRREWAFIARDSEIKVLFAASPAIYRQVMDLPRSIATLKHVVLLGGEGAERTLASLVAVGTRQPVPAVHPAATETACLLYTSGTTGEPKGVVLTHGNIVSNVRGLLSVMPLSEEYRTLSFLPWAHAFGHTVELHLLIAAGGSMGIAESVDKIVDNFIDVRPMALVAVPRVFMRVYGGVHKMIATKPRFVRWLFRRGLELARKKREGGTLGPLEGLVHFLADRLVFSGVRARFGGRLKFAVSGAAALAREVAEFIDALGIAVYEGYGLTETSPVVTANVPGKRKFGSVGRPLPGVRVIIDKSAGVDPDNKNVGEVVVYGPNVMVGYHRREDETRAMFTRDGGLRTGDLGYLDDEDFLFITGRIKEQYKLTNGKYVVPAPLEERLKLSPFITNVMVYGDNRPFNVALVVPNRDQLHEWAVAERIPIDSMADLIASPRARDKLRAELDRLSTDCKGYERIKNFVLILEDFTQENDMLTPSLKLKRRNVVDRWRRELEHLYRESTQEHSAVI